jgi:cobalt-zinc-cadmium efflux system outer membrane protein
MRRRLLCAAFAVAFGPGGVGAQSLMLTESDALARLSTASPRVRAIEATIELARADVLAAARWPNPRLTINRESVAGVTEYLTMVAQPLPVTGRRDLEVESASAGMAAASSRASDERRRLEADLRLTFADLLSAQVRERELTATGGRLKDLAEVLAQRETAGDLAGFDRLRAERELLDIETDLAVAATDRARAQATLASYLADVSDPMRIVAIGGPSARPDLPPLDALFEQAEATRGEYLALRQEVDAANFAARAAQRHQFPEPEIVAGAKSSTIAGGDLGSIFSIHATLPLFDHGQPEGARAEARAARAQAQTEAFRLTLRGQITALRASVVERRRTAARYRSEAVSSADEIERIAQVSYDAGERGILELLDAFRIGSASRTRQAMLDTAVRQAEIELAFVSGWEIP